jgi:hypothetical protein
MAEKSRFGEWGRWAEEAGDMDDFETGEFVYETVPNVTQVWVADLEYHCTCDDYHGSFDCGCGR